MRRLVTEPYREQVKLWPKDGRHILAQFDADSVVVYQAYRWAGPGERRTPRSCG